MQISKDSSIRSIIIAEIAVIGLAIFDIQAVYAKPTGVGASATASATASVTIVQPLKVVSLKNMNFGEVYANNSAQTVTLDPSGVRTASNGDILGDGSGVSAASFNVSGERQSSFKLTLPTSLTLSAGSNSLTVSGFTSDIESNVGILDSTGIKSINVGATLNVNAKQASGDYTGSFDVTVAYE